MPGMPYHLEKGPWLSLLEDYVNGPATRAASTLTKLRDGTPLTDIGFLESPVLDGDPERPTLADRKRHLAVDWFGHPVGEAQQTFESAVGALMPGGTTLDAVDDTREGATALAEAAIRAGLSVPFPSTGFWHRYWGDVEGMVRTTLACALEVSWAINSGEAPPEGEAADARLPIEIFWKCPQRWFEGWVTWRYDPETGNGHVMALFATPGSGKPLLERPGAGKDATYPNGPAAAEPAPDQLPSTPPAKPDAPMAAKGMWVISHADHVLLPSLPASRAGRSGEWVLPSFGPAYLGVGPIDVVSPSEADGGVLPWGRSYEEAAGA